MNNIGRIFRGVITWLLVLTAGSIGVANWPAISSGAGALGTRAWDGISTFLSNANPFDDAPSATLLDPKTAEAIQLSNAQNELAEAEAKNAELEKELSTLRTQGIVPLTSGDVLTGEVNAVITQPVVSLAALQPYTGFVNAVAYFDGTALTEIKMRGSVRTPGDIAVFIYEFPNACISCTISRLVADDFLTKAVFYSPDFPGGLDIAPLLQMSAVPTATKDLSAEHRAYLEVRGINLNGEQLPQNLFGVHLGTVQEGSYIVFEVQDDKALQVNRGLNFVLTFDTDPYTVELNGKPVAEPTYVIKP